VYLIKTQFGNAFTRTLSSAMAIRADFGGHITEEKTYCCPACHTRQTREDSYIGTLGKVRHHRCTACGITWSER